MAISEKLMAKAAGSKVLRKCVGRPFMLLSELIWPRVPKTLLETRLFRKYGNLLFKLSGYRFDREEFLWTCFFRSRAEMEVIREIACTKPLRSPLRIAVLGCSKGCEVYSVLWAVRSAREDLNLEVKGVDISEEALAVGRQGVYSMGSSELSQLSDEEIEVLFDRDGDQVKIKPWISRGSAWYVGDARDPRLPELLGVQDIVLANRFLFHMDAKEAETCLRNIVKLLTPGGYLFVSGVDLDVRTRVARTLGLEPLMDTTESLHEGDRTLRDGWPFNYWGLEPLDKSLPDWEVRYACVFRLGAEGTTNGA